MWQSSTFGRRAFISTLLGTMCGGGRILAQTVDTNTWRKPEFTGQPLSGLRVAVDIGHYRAKAGATSARGLAELEFNDATARVIASVLESAGAQVILVNKDGNVTGLRDRPAIAAKAKADCFVSIHHDSVNDKYIRTWNYGGKTQEYCDQFRGYGVFTSSKNEKAEKSRELALALGRTIYETGLRPALHHAEPIQGENRPLLDATTGVYEFSDLVVLKSASMPAILLECGVIVHRDEELLVQRPEYRDLLAHALVRAIAETFHQGGKRGFKGIFRKSSP